MACHINGKSDSWYKHGKEHRDPNIGPARIYYNRHCGDFLETYFFEGKRHNPFGPAIVKEHSLMNEWYINGKKIKDENQMVTRVWTDEKKGYYHWINQKNEMHRPLSGPFARDDCHDIDFTHCCQPAMRDENGGYYYTNGCYLPINFGTNNSINSKKIENNCIPSALNKEKSSLQVQTGDTTSTTNVEPSN